jgi:hypothetical protein
MARPAKGLQTTAAFFPGQQCAKAGIVLPKTAGSLFIE